MYNPDETLIELLRRKDKDFEQLHDSLKKLEEKFYDPSSSENDRKKMLPQMRRLKQCVDERISVARSA